MIRNHTFIAYVFYIMLQLHSNNYLSAQCFHCGQAPQGTIFCDDFEEDIPFNQKYFEYNNNARDFIRLKNIGRDQSFGMRAKFQKGEVAAGSLSKSFGKTPDTYIGKNASMPGLSFDEVYWRMDVKHQDAWLGNGPAKLSRAMCLANSNWAQGMMAHIWSGGNNDWYLGMDPATGIGADGKLKSTKYNDFNNLRWLGFKSGTTPLYHDNNAGKWYCIVAHVKLNTPGQKNGIFEFWINDTLQASSNNLDWHNQWNLDPKNLHINAIFFENYWNDGSPVEQERYFDNLVISTQPIKCECNITSTSKQNPENEIQVFPNPTSGELHFQIPNNQLPLKISISNLQNQILINKIIYSESESIELPGGIYILKFNKNIKPKRVVVSGF